MESVYKVGSLFAGVGGVCLGFKQATFEDKRYELIWANEMDSYACETYRTNFDHKLLEGDITLVLNPRKIDVVIEEKENLIKKLEVNIENSNKQNEIKKLKSKLNKANNELTVLKERKEEKYYEKLNEVILSERIDILTGGFPCQAFSIAGDRKGFEDERGNLFWSFIHLVTDLEEIHGKPRILFLENVKNLKSHDKGKTYKVIKKELEKIGYTVKEQVLNTMQYSNLPQNRERIYIVGFLNKSDAERFDIFDKINEIKNNKKAKERELDVKQVIDYNLSKDNYEKYYYTRDKYPHYFLTEQEYSQLDEIKKKKERINLDEQINEMYQFYQVRRGMYVRKNKSNVCPTLTANMGTGGHNVPLIKVHDGIRKLTPEETFKLQGFPVGSDYKLPKKYDNRLYPTSRLYKQAGNAVSVPVIELLAKEILKVL